MILNLPDCIVVNGKTRGHDSGGPVEPEIGNLGGGHYATGKKLAALRRKNILVIATGNIVHNLRLLDFHGPLRLGPSLPGGRESIHRHAR